MDRRGKLTMAAGATLVAIALLLPVLFPREPTYQGLTMGQWLTKGYNEQANEALFILGTNNLPLLINRVAYNSEKDVLSRILLWLARKSDSTRISQIATHRKLLAQQSCAVIARLGPKAASAIPQLAKVVDQGAPFASQLALGTLPSFGDEGLAVIAARITSANLATRRYAAGLLALHPESPIARSAFTNLLNDPDPQVRALALTCLHTPR